MANRQKGVMATIHRWLHHLTHRDRRETLKAVKKEAEEAKASADEAKGPPRQK